MSMPTVQPRLPWLAGGVACGMLLIGMAVTSPAAEPPYAEDQQTLTVLNRDGVETIRLSPRENATIIFADPRDLGKLQIRILTYENRDVLKPTNMSRKKLADGTYTYTLRFSTQAVFKGQEDWYYFLIGPNSSNASPRGHLIVGNPPNPHWIKTYADSAYTEEADVFNSTDTVYVEIRGNDYGTPPKSAQVDSHIVVHDYSRKAYQRNPLGRVVQNGGTYRFSVNLSENSRRPYAKPWWYSFKAVLRQEGETRVSFRGFRQIQILPPGQSGGSWSQIQWHEVE